jgi:hypothetical protein
VKKRAREKESKRAREQDSKRARKTENQKTRKTEKQKNRKTEKQKNRKTEKQKNRKTEKQKNRNTETQKHRKMKRQREPRMKWRTHNSCAYSRSVKNVSQARKAISSKAKRKKRKSKRKAAKIRAASDLDRVRCRICAIPLLRSDLNLHLQSRTHSHYLATMTDQEKKDEAKLVELENATEFWIHSAEAGWENAPPAVMPLPTDPAYPFIFFRTPQ